ncbi:MAG: hypothetical protein ACREC6_12940 [Hyphomicrobiaceae bacterium]
MTLSLDGYDVLRRIGAHAAAFAAVKGDVAKTAEMLVKKQLKSKGTDLASLRTLVVVLGHDTLALVLETCSAGELRGFLKTFDPSCDVAKIRDSASARRHLLALAEGRIRPAKASAVAGKPSRWRNALPKFKAASPFGTRAMGAKSEV